MAVKEQDTVEGGTGYFAHERYQCNTKQTQKKEVWPQSLGLKGNLSPQKGTLSSDD